MLDTFDESPNTGYCVYSSCNEWDIILKMFYDAFSDSRQHMLVLKNVETFVKKNDRFAPPDSMRLFQMISDRGIEAGAFEKKVWNLASDECNANISNCRVLRHSDSALEPGSSSS